MSIVGRTSKSTTVRLSGKRSTLSRTRTHGSKSGSRQHGQSLSMKHWIDHHLTIHDVETMFGIDPSSGNDNDWVVRSALQRQLSFYDGPNPFVKILPFTAYEKFKIVLFIVSGILLVKLIIVLILVIFGYLFSIPITICRNKPQDIKDEKGLNSFRKPFVYGLRILTRIYLFLAGLYWISVTDIKKNTKNNNKNTNTNTNRNKNKNDNSLQKSKLPRVIVANHVSSLDAPLMFWLFGKSYILLLL